MLTVVDKNKMVTTTLKENNVVGLKSEIAYRPIPLNPPRCSTNAPRAHCSDDPMTIWLILTNRFQR